MYHRSHLGPVEPAYVWRWVGPCAKRHSHVRWLRITLPGVCPSGMAIALDFRRTGKRKLLLRQRIRQMMLNLRNRSHSSGRSHPRENGPANPSARPSGAHSAGGAPRALPENPMSALDTQQSGQSADRCPRCGAPNAVLKLLTSMTRVLCMRSLWVGVGNGAPDQRGGGFVIIW